MQRIATKVFIYSSIAFGIIGISFVLTNPGTFMRPNAVSQILNKLLLIDVFIILPSFALSVAGKFLNGKL